MLIKIGYDCYFHLYLLQLVTREEMIERRITDPLLPRYVCVWKILCQSSYFIVNHFLFSFQGLPKQNCSWKNPHMAYRHSILWAKLLYRTDKVSSKVNIVVSILIKSKLYWGIFHFVTLNHENKCLCLLIKKSEDFSTHLADWTIGLGQGENFLMTKLYTGEQTLLQWYKSEENWYSYDLLKILKAVQTF